MFRVLAFHMFEMFTPEVWKDFLLPILTHLFQMGGDNTALSCGTVKLLVENLGIVVEIPLYDWGSPKILSEAFTSPIVDLLPTQTSKL